MLKWSRYCPPKYIKNIINNSFWKLFTFSTKNLSKAFQSMFVKCCGEKDSCRQLFLLTTGYQPLYQWDNMRSFYHFIFYFMSQSSNIKIEGIIHAKYYILGSIFIKLYIHDHQKIYNLVHSSSSLFLQLLRNWQLDTMKRSYLSMYLQCIWCLQLCLLCLSRVARLHALARILAAADYPEY